MFDLETLTKNEIHQDSDNSGSLQEQLDAFCESLDDICEDHNFARFGQARDDESTAWRCYKNVSQNSKKNACVTDDGSWMKCSEPFTEDGTYCTRDRELNMIIEETKKGKLNWVMGQNET